MNSHEDTIAAIASASGGGARGIVRISGPAAIDCVRPLFEPNDVVDHRNGGNADPFPRSLPIVLPGRLRIADFHAPIPADVCIWPTERSYTRRPSVELHVPGSAPIVDAVLAEVCRHGARPAKPGEFTLQAFLAGRIDLTQAEAVLGVVDAADERGLAGALKQMAGGLAEPLKLLRSDLLNLIADLEAGLDFVEEDIEFIDLASLIARLTAAREVVAALAARMAARGESTELPRVVLIGKPNAGKSTLFNALAGGERALVSPLAGTTRDYLTCRLTFDGIECEFIDTAGLDEEMSLHFGDASADPDASISAASQTATAQRRQEADLVLFCLDDDSPPDPMTNAPGSLIVRTKCDLTTASGDVGSADSSDREIAVSSATGAGLEALKHAIARELVAVQTRGSDVVGTTAVRCRDSLHRAAEALNEALRAARSRIGDELVAAELRLAIEELGRIAGVVYTDDILDRIFSRFCIGK
jgi:tRNA modification GTPase